MLFQDDLQRKKKKRKKKEEKRGLVVFKDRRIIRLINLCSLVLGDRCPPEVVGGRETRFPPDGAEKVGGIRKGEENVVK